MVDIDRGGPPHPASVSDDFYRDCIAALGCNGQEAALVLDDRGNVLFCSRECADLLSCDAEDILGRHITTFFPTLSLSAHAPGCNVATAAHWGRHNRWLPCSASPECHGIDVELRLDTVLAGYRHLILAWVRFVPNAMVAPQSGAGPNLIESLPDARPHNAIRRQMAPPHAQAMAAIPETS